MAAAKKKPEAGKRLDLTFLSFVLILLTTGLVMLFSASYAYSYEYYGNSYKFITRQAAFAAAGVALMLLISKIDYHFWRRFAWITYVLAIGMLAVLLVTEARHRLRSKAIPEAFRGLPITLVYIGVLALAIYGFTGHSVIL